MQGSAREASSCLKTGIKRTPPTLATFAKHPHLAGRTMPGKQSGLEETAGGKLRLEDSDLRPHGGRVRARVPTPTRRPGTPLAARASPSAKPSRGRPGTRPGAGGPGDTGREGRLRAVRAPRRRWGPRLVPEPRLAAGGARGAGARRRAHSTPAATPCTKWALSGPPFRSPAGSSSGAPPERRRARRRGGGWDSQGLEVPSRARLSGRTAGTGRRAALTEPSPGAGPTPGSGAQQEPLGQRAGAEQRSPSGGLRPRGRCPRPAAAWAVARPGRAKDAPWLCARAPAARRAAGGRTTGRAGPARRFRAATAGGCSWRRATKPGRTPLRRPLGSSLRARRPRADRGAHWRIAALAARRRWGRPRRPRARLLPAESTARRSPTGLDSGLLRACARSPP